VFLLKVSEAISEYFATMAGLFEIHCFVGKCLKILKAGGNDSLRLGCKARKASIFLHLELNQQVPPQQFKSQNACDRCCQRRADARQSHAKVTEENIAAEIRK
jgi:hypothetical protein